ncbi:beta-phosphoglucomutase [Tenericutes bacterium MO-XQ]|nr:beta-phosphoglucomutase [Tenericutes bacterium MO-XQ]
MKGIIFDLDGVIIHTDHYHYLAWEKMASQFHLSFDEMLNHKLRGISRMESLNTILEYNKASYPYEQKEMMADIKNTYYQSFLDDLTEDDLDQEIKDTLDKLKALGFKLAIGSSSRNAKLILKNIGLINFFDAISDGTNIEKSKPDPEVFLKAADMLDLNPKDCYVIEDAEAGIEAAKNADMIAIGFGNAKESELTDIKLETFSDLLDIVKKED